MKEQGDGRGGRRKEEMRKEQGEEREGRNRVWKG